MLTVIKRGERKMYYAITNLNNAKGLAAKMRRWSERDDGYAWSIKQRGTTVIVEKDRKPWAELTGHMTNTTQIFSCETLEKALEKK